MGEGAGECPPRHARRHGVRRLHLGPGPRPTTRGFAAGSAGWLGLPGTSPEHSTASSLPTVRSRIRTNSIPASLSAWPGPYCGYNGRKSSWRNIRTPELLEMCKKVKILSDFPVLRQKFMSLKNRELRKAGGGRKKGAPKMKVFLEMLMKTKGGKMASAHFCRCY